MKIINFPQSYIEYRDYYNVFCEVFDLIQIRKRINIVAGIIIEIRTKEEGHNIPHIHARYHNDNISISLIDGKILAGNIPIKKQKIAQKWVIDNLNHLREEWKDIHGKIIFPDMNKKRG